MLWTTESSKLSFVKGEKRCWKQFQSIHFPVLVFVTGECADLVSHRKLFVYLGGWEGIKTAL